jgi:phage baseplate assembly protein V
LVRRNAAMLDAQRGHLRFGIVSSYDPNTGSAQVLFQPEGVLSGWLPVLSQSVGSGWGEHTPLNVGDQVAALPQEGDANHGIILGRTYSNAARPPSAAGADRVFWSSAGASIAFMTNGKVVVTDPSGASLTMQNNGTVTVNGVLNVTGTLKVNNVTVNVP